MSVLMYQVVLDVGHRYDNLKELLMSTQPVDVPGNSGGEEIQLLLKELQGHICYADGCHNRVFPCSVLDDLQKLLSRGEQSDTSLTGREIFFIEKSVGYKQVEGSVSFKGCWTTEAKAKAWVTGQIKASTLHPLRWKGNEFSYYRGNAQVSYRVRKLLCQ
jgi:hypothetical protein